MTNINKTTSFNKEAFKQTIKKLIAANGGISKFMDILEDKALSFGYEFNTEQILPSEGEIREYTSRRTPRIDFLLLLAYAFDKDVDLDSFLS